MYAKFILLDRKLQLAAGTTRRVYNALKDEGLIQYISKEERITDDQVKEFRDIFSKKNANIAGLMGDRLSVKDRLDTFMLMYNYDWEEILAAARNYIHDRQESDRPDLIMRADNFIKKVRADETTFSRLAEYCERLGENVNNPFNDTLI